MKTRNKMEVQCKANPNNTYLWTQLKNMTKKVKSHLRRLSKLHGQKLLKASNNTKKAWKFIREMTFTVKNKSKPSIDPVILNEFFSSMVQDSPSSLPHKQDLSFLSDSIPYHEHLKKADTKDCSQVFSVEPCAIEALNNMTKSDNLNSNDFHLECVTISNVVKMLG